MEGTCLGEWDIINPAATIGSIWIIWLCHMSENGIYIYIYMCVCVCDIYIYITVYIYDVIYRWYGSNSLSLSLTLLIQIYIPTPQSTQYVLPTTCLKNSLGATSWSPPRDSALVQMWSFGSSSWGPTTGHQGFSGNPLDRNHWHLQVRRCQRSLKNVLFQHGSTKTQRTCWKRHLKMQVVSWTYLTPLYNRD